MTKDEWDEADETKELFLREVIHPLLPNARYSFTVHNGDYNNPASTFHGTLSTSDLLRNSPYEWKKKRLIHFTTLQGLTSIIKSGFFRMTEFNSLNDKEELSYASMVFNDNAIFRLNEPLLKKTKSALYCFSACESNAKTLKDTFMWENYASKGKGVVIEFSINEKNPHSFAIGKVKYGKGELEALELLKNRAIKFHREHNLFPHNPIELFSLFKSFHKSMRYKNEQEIRILFSPNGFGQTSRSYPSVYQDINSENEMTTFNRIYLKGHAPFKERNTAIFPEIKIHKVILGYGISIENKLEIAQHLRALKSTDLKFDVYHIDNDLNIINFTKLADLNRHQ